MDYLAHALWTYIFFHKTKKPFYAVLFGVMADSFSWLIYLIYLIFTGSVFGRPNPEIVPDWVFTLYGITHSLFSVLLVLIIVYLIFRKIPIYIYAWPIHILIDIPTHTRDFLPTPFLWPISNWHFPGISWGTPWFMVLNYSLIVGFLLIIWVMRKRN